MAEVHILGTLLGASEFTQPALSCRYKFISGDSWALLEGNASGQTHVDIPSNPTFTLWSQPLDVHYNTKSITGWPKLTVNIYHQDIFGRNIHYAYGFAHIPTCPGIHDLEIATWKPIGTKNDQLWETYLGTSVELKDPNIVHEPTDRFKLLTRSMGRVHVKLMIVMRNFKSNGITM